MRAPMPRRTRPEASDQLPRQWALLRLLGGGRADGYAVRELAEQLGTSKSNVERDLAALQSAGFPLKSQPDPSHRQRLRWMMDGAPQLAAAPTFGAAELLALYAASSMLGFMAETPIHQDLQSVLCKVRGMLADNQNKSVQRMGEVFTSHLRNHVSYQADDARAILDDLMDATARQRRCEVRYKAAEVQAPKVHVIRPLRIFGHHNALYVFVQIEPRTEIRTLAVHRILELTVLKDSFEVPHADLDAYAEQAFGVAIEEPKDVEVLFDKEVARYALERSFHPREQKEVLPDGRVCYRVKAGGRREMVAWVLSFAGAATLVKPEAWREDVTNAAMALRKGHQA